MQSSDVFLGDPGLGKGLGAEWREDLLFSCKRMLQDYADSENRASKLTLIGPLNEGLDKSVNVMFLRMLVVRNE